MNTIKFFKQTDKEYKDIEMVKGVKIGDYGCLLVSLTNVLLSSGRPEITPSAIDKVLDDNNGYTAEGCVMWPVFERLFNVKHSFLARDQFCHINDDPKKFWIVQTKYKSTGHFSIVTGALNDSICYFDSYDGITKSVRFDQCLSVREIDILE